MELSFEKSGQVYDKRHLFIIKDKVYHLKDWIDRHPGGSKWFVNSWCRDITGAIYAYHKDPSKLEKILKRFEVDILPDEIRHPYLNVPKFILPKDFNVKTDILTYNWDNPNGFLKTLQSRINTPSMQSKIKRADVLFDIVAVILLVAHIAMMFVGVPYNVLPLWGCVIFFTVTRTALAAVGHYHCHRKKDGISDWGDSLFDMQYVGASIILFDGHVMNHHLYTNSPADVKRTVFTGMLTLPRLFRVPVLTLQKFGQFLTGYFIRWYKVMSRFNTEQDFKMSLKDWQLLAVRLLLLAEFVFCVVSGYWLLWVLQFISTTWLNLFLIVSSHDFEEEETSARLEHGQDWGVFQIENSFDMSVVGNGYIDCFLTAGLGTHRTHHVLPNQRSGFSNMVSNRVVKTVWQEYGGEWKRPQNFLLERFPKLFVYYLFAPVKLEPTMTEGPPIEETIDNHYNPVPDPEDEMKKNPGFFMENFSFQAFRGMGRFIYLGFKGEGSI